MIMYYIIIFEMLYFGKNVKAEWVEIPEFSDEKKVYRIPFSNRDYEYKFIRNDDNKNFFHKEENSTIYEKQPDINIPLTHNSDVNITQLSVTELNTGSEKYFTNVSTDYIVENNCDIKNNSYEMDKLLIESDPIKLEEHIPDTKMYDTKEAILKQQLPLSNKNLNETLKEDKNTFLMYLPTEILKNVHKNLKSQPSSIKGKLQFLKSFEKILSLEIESRLIRFINPNRIKRGSDHYDHDDYEDHGLGFPSLEGALMAISFLTFAVYLVRLVMLLFRNNGTQGTIPTVLVGKKKRSLEEFNEETARILRNVDNFISNI
ncbi:uncharacterized protein LOC118443778 [Vespa mandarinia]|uniref:uncharacterized protein LOC118443778 n=1 Tax=Vespa mandarinia TaxID=7446 RepID=UPI00160EC219|nr:uncharacterized protein LOC118443778 [Vespa mandarinia]